MILSVIFTVFVTIEVYNKWHKRPLIISFSEKYTRVSEIPFPGVTICPETKFRSTILNFTDLHDRWVRNGLMKLELEEKESLNQMIAVLQICSETVNKELKETDQYKFTTPEIFDIIKQIAPNFNNTLLNCKFQNQEKPCSSYFQELITEEGICYTFNSLAPSDIYNDIVYLSNSMDTYDRAVNLSNNWSLDEGYVVKDSSYPLRVFGSGSRDGLTVTLSLNKSEFDKKCRSNVQGFKVQLHMPGDIPLLSKHYFHLPMQRDLVVSVSPNIIKTDKDLHHYGSDIRQCFFAEEKHLKFFKTYSKSNCDFECLTNYTLQHCGCVRFSMPRTNDTLICGIQQIDCCINAEDELLRKDDVLLGSNEFDDCNCLPSCTSYSYAIDQSHNIISDISENEIATIRIFFREKQFISSKRSKLYGDIEVLANFGGLLGFFLGISALSFVELIYFFTLRTFLIIKKNGLGGSANNFNKTSNIKINIIRASTLTEINQDSIAKNDYNLFLQRRNVSANFGHQEF